MNIDTAHEVHELMSDRDALKRNIIAIDAFMQRALNKGSCINVRFSADAVDHQIKLQDEDHSIIQFVKENLECQIERIELKIEKDY
jgi:hypothetical protein